MRSSTEKSPCDDASTVSVQALGLRLGQEPDVAEVDAQQGRRGGPGKLGGAEQRAVSADDDHELGALGGVRAGRHLLHAGAVDVDRLGRGDPYLDAGGDEPLDDEPASARSLRPGSRRDQERSVCCS